MNIAPDTLHRMGQRAAALQEIAVMTRSLIQALDRTNLSCASADAAYDPLTRLTIRATAFQRTYDRAYAMATEIVALKADALALRAYRNRRVAA